MERLIPEQERDDDENYKKLGTLEEELERAVAQMRKRGDMKQVLKSEARLAMRLRALIARIESGAEGED